MKRLVISTAIIIICIMTLPMIGGTLTIKSTNAHPPNWWSTFRHDSTHSGYSISTAPRTNQTLWNYTTGEDVLSSPAVVDGVVFVGSADGKVYALDAFDGSEVWNYTTGDVVFSSPAVVDGVVFVGSADGKVYALDAFDGSEVWNYTTVDAVFSSPAVAGGVVFVGSDDHKVYALDAFDGSLIWSYTTGSYVDSSPAVAGGVVFVGSFDGKVYALDASDGSLVWSYTTGDVVFSSPAVAGGVVFVGSDDGKVYAFYTHPFTTVGGEISQARYIGSFVVPELVMIGIFGAIVMLVFVGIKRSKQTRLKPQ